MTRYLLVLPALVLLALVIAARTSLRCLLAAWDRCCYAIRAFTAEPAPAPELEPAPSVSDRLQRLLAADDEHRGRQAELLANLQARIAENDRKLADQELAANRARFDQARIKFEADEDGTWSRWRDMRRADGWEPS